MITLNEAKAYLGVTTTATDALITTIINNVTAEIESVCGRKLMEHVYSNEVLSYEISDYDGQYNPEIDLESDYLKLFLKNYPVQSLSLTADGVEVDDANYDIDANNGVVTMYQAESDDKGRLKATYTAGYTLTTGSSFTVPDDLKMVAYQGVKYEYSYSGVTTQGQSNVTSKSVGSFSVTYNKDNIKPIAMGMEKPYIALNIRTLNRYSGTRL